jgi:hypothetical protein
MKFGNQFFTFSFFLIFITIQFIFCSVNVNTSHSKTGKLIFHKAHLKCLKCFQVTKLTVRHPVRPTKFRIKTLTTEIPSVGIYFNNIYKNQKLFQQRVKVPRYNVRSRFISSFSMKTIFEQNKSENKRPQ